MKYQQSSLPTNYKNDADDLALSLRCVLRESLLLLALPPPPFVLRSNQVWRVDSRQTGFTTGFSVARSPSQACSVLRERAIRLDSTQLDWLGLRDAIRAGKSKRNQSGSQGSAGLGGQAGRALSRSLLRSASQLASQSASQSCQLADLQADSRLSATALE